MDALADEEHIGPYERADPLRSVSRSNKIARLRSTSEKYRRTSGDTLHLHAIPSTARYAGRFGFGA